MSEFRMPSLGADMEAGTLVEWTKAPGDTVARGDIVAVVDTDKGAIEIEVFEPGTIERLLVEPGQKVPVGTALAIIRGANETPGAAAPAAVGAPAAPVRTRVSPAARKAAEQLHVDLAGVVGQGPGGAITVADVERAAAAGPPAPKTSTRAAGMRAAIGAAMARSKREIPHLYLSTTVDVTQPLAWLGLANQARPVTERLLPIVLFLKAVANAAVEVPAVNGTWNENGFVPGAGVHIGCAIALRDGGLVAPALHDVDKKSLGEAGRDLMDLVSRARAGSLRSSEMTDATITLTNLGDLGVDAAYAVIYPPQVAIVAIGRVVERPWVVAGRVEPRSVVTLSLSADHRAVDGRQAGAFLAAVERALQAPEAL
ncbi:MAG: dihydrolipoamide acetyltransferase family protein [Vicinamibacterales bacterium]|jgi:pyruvate dehydrogenase E2 component (dihydrolipoamide acetyltransferase)